MSSVFPEWLQANLTRRYPLSDQSEGTGTTPDGGIPDALLVDAWFTVPPQFITTNARLYVSSVQSSQGLLKILLGIQYESNGAVQALNDVLVTSGQVALGRRWKGPDTYITHMIAMRTTDSSAQLPSWISGISGQLVIADTTDSRLYSDITISSPSQTYIHKHCVHQETGVTAIIVGESRLTGQVVLQFGTGISVQVQQQTNTIILTSSTSVSSLKQSMIADFGSPIYTINGVRPDSSGNLQIRGADCTQITALGAGTIVISNPCSVPCCSDQGYQVMQAKLQTVRNAIKVLDNYYVSLSSAINSMTSRLSLLISSQE